MAPAPDTPVPPSASCAIRKMEDRALRLFGGDAASREAITAKGPAAGGMMIAIILSALDHPAVKARVVAIIHEAKLRGLRP